MKPEVGNSRLPAGRIEAVLNVPHVPAISVPENIARFLRHLREDFIGGVIDREHTDGVVLGYGQDVEAVIQFYIIPLQPQYFAPTHAGGQGYHDHVPERMRRGRAAGQELVHFFEG